MGIDIQSLKDYEEYSVYTETHDDRVEIQKEKIKIEKIEVEAERRSAQLKNLVNTQIEIDLGGKLAIQAGYDKAEVAQMTRDKARDSLKELGWNLSSLTPPGTAKTETDNG